MAREHHESTMTRKSDTARRAKLVAPKRRKVEPEILQAAIKLFGQYGYRGVTTRDIAHEANVVEGSIYQWFKSKEYLYLQAVNAVIADINEEFGKFLIAVFGQSEQVDLARISAAVQSWFASLPQAGAQLLMQAMRDDKVHKIARQPLDQLVNVLTKALASQNPKFDAQAAAMCLVRALFLTRVATESPTLANKEITQMSRLFFSCMMPSSSK